MHSAASRSSTIGADRESAACFLCGAQSGRVVLCENGYDGVHCACGTIFVRPRPAHADDDDTLVMHPDDFYDLAAERKARWVRAHTAGRTLLEIGCGSGAFLDAATRAGFLVEGVEPVASRAQQARDRTGRPVHEAWLHNFVSTARHDVVYHCDLLSHFSDPANALGRMRALLTPGGALAFEVGLVADVSTGWYGALPHPGFPMHRWFYSERSIRALMRRAGLRITATRRYDQSAQLLLAVAIRVAHRTARRAGWRSTTHGAVTSVDTSGDASTDAAGGAHDGWLESQPFYTRLQNWLRYSVGGVLPAIGPGTLLVVAEAA
jgi:SAM-dependent methyltransferase